MTNHKLALGSAAGTPFTIPVDNFVTKAAAIVGIRGSGKTYGAMKLFEGLYETGQQVVVLDPVGVWWSMRVAANGKDVGLDVSIFGGLHGDIPLNRNAGALIADTIIDRNISAVIDVSQFETDADKTKFAHDFADRFYWRKKSSAIKTAVHIFVEEAQEFISQNPQKGEERMLHVWQRMIRLGRNFKIGVSMISQRPQDVNKKALNQAEWVFAFQLRGTQERKAVEDWIANNGIDEKLAQKLPGLSKGEAYVWSPLISTVVRIGKKRTFDASADVARHEEVSVEPKPLRPHELTILQETLKALVEEQAASDPRELTKRLAEKDRRIQELEQTGGKPDESVVQEAVAKALLVRDNHWQGEVKKLRDVVDRVVIITQSARESLSAVGGVEIPEIIAPPKPDEVKTSQIRPPKVAFVSYAPRLALPATNVIRREGISDGLRRILTSLAQYGPLNKDRLGILAELITRGGGWNTNIKIATDKGWLYVNDRQEFEITADGLGALGSYDPLPTGADRIQRWRERLHSDPSSGIVRIFDIICQAWPNRISHQDISDATGLQARGGGWNTNLSTLRSKGLIEGGNPVKASDNLFT